MLFTSETELRFYFPTHAIDSLDPFMGVIDNSEHDFLQEKLGTPLYDALCDWYADNGTVGSGSAAAIDTRHIGHYNRLLLLCQRAVAYDAMSRAVELGIISPNNAGVNIPTSDDYGKVDLAAVEKFRTRCITEAHAAINLLLQTLEVWHRSVCDRITATQSKENNSDSVLGGFAAEDSGASVPAGPASGNSEQSEQEEIVALWRESRYFYLAASLLIPSARVLQDYLNIYDSREKFIQMLPDLRYIQEEIIAPAIGEDLCAYIVAFSRGEIKEQPEKQEAGQSEASTPGAKIAEPVPYAAILSQPSRAEANSSFFILHSSLLKKLRKLAASMLEERTSVLKLDKERRLKAHDESVRLLQSALDYIRTHQSDFPEAVITTSPIYTPPPKEDPKESPVCCCNTAAPTDQRFQNNRRGSALFLTPFLN